MAEHLERFRRQDLLGGFKQHPFLKADVLLQQFAEMPQHRHIIDPGKRCPDGGMFGTGTRGKCRFAGLFQEWQEIVFFDLEVWLDFCREAGQDGAAHFVDRVARVTGSGFLGMQRQGQGRLVFAGKRLECGDTFHAGRLI